MAGVKGVYDPVSQLQTPGIVKTKSMINIELHSQHKNCIGLAGLNIIL
jgi:hypothetical protein